MITTHFKKGHFVLTYHVLLGIDGRPRDEKLYPLAELQEKYADLFEKHVKKYAGRESTLTRKIPPLDCAWSDAVFLMPVHPQKICQAIATHTNRHIPTVVYFTIDTSTLDQHRLAVRMFETEQFDLEEMQLLSDAEHRVSTEVPDRTIAYLKKFRDFKSEQDRPKWIMYVPHIFHRGSIEVRNLELQYTTPCAP